jgi:hypothetical protein
MKELIGRKVIAYRFDNEGEKLIFTTDKGEIEYETSGDCCSRSFFSDVEGMDNLLGYVVNEVVERQEWTPEETKKAESQGSYDSLSLYGYLIKTERGTCDFEFRNDSNGYYGGSCYCVRDETRKNESN